MGGGQPPVFLTLLVGGVGWGLSYRSYPTPVGRGGRVITPTCVYPYTLQNRLKHKPLSIARERLSTPTVLENYLFSFLTSLQTFSHNSSVFKWSFSARTIEATYSFISGLESGGQPISMIFGLPGNLLLFSVGFSFAYYSLYHTLSICQVITTNGVCGVRWRQSSRGGGRPPLLLPYSFLP